MDLSSLRKKNKAIDVLVAGAFKDVKEYPTVYFRIRALLESNLSVVVCNEAPSSNRHWARTGMGIGALAGISRSFLHTWFNLWKYRHARAVYLPYPSLIGGLALLCHPCGGRFRVIVDGFISVYDTAVIDRQILRRNGLVARALHFIESRIFERADVIVVDTEENAAYYRNLFKLRSDSFVALPIPFDDEMCSAPCKQTPSVARDGGLNVLFVGTMIPLHGIQYLANTILKLNNSNITVRIIGDGQDANILEKHFGSKKPMDATPEVTWIREWQSPQSIAAHIAWADLCLGIFGDTEKTKRVWPLKNYLYMAAAKPFITARTPVSTRMEKLSQKPFFFQIDVGDDNALVQILNEQAELGARVDLENMGANARAVFDRNFLNESWQDKFIDAMG